MSDVPVQSARVRVNRRRTEAARQRNPQREPQRGPKSRWPWHDHNGRFSTLKMVLLVVAAAPLAWLLYADQMNQLGARPTTEVIHQTGLLAVRFLLLSLMVSPARAIFNWHRVMLVRRQLGLTALLYGLVHLVLYARDQNWAMMHVAMEILQRFYLTIGFVALVGLAVLGVTSTDRAQRMLGHAWKRLHRTVYAFTALGLFHFFLQSKADVSEATLMAGLFVWMLGWRMIPSGPNRAPLPLLGLSLAAAVATLALEYAWFACGTNIDPARVLIGEADIAFGPHAAGQVLIIGLCLTVAASLFWAAHRERLRTSVLFDMALYAGGALIVAGLSFCFSLTDDWLPDDWVFWHAALGFVAAAGLVGIGRWLLPRGHRVLDGAIAACLALPLLVGLAV